MALDVADDEKHGHPENPPAQDNQQEAPVLRDLCTDVPPDLLLTRRLANRPMRQQVLARQHSVHGPRPRHHERQDNTAEHQEHHTERPQGKAPIKAIQAGQSGHDQQKETHSGE